MATSENFFIKLYHLIFPEELQVKYLIKSKLPELKQLINAEKAKTCLEAGSAEGYILRSLLKERYIQSGVAIDLRKYYLERGQKLANKEGLKNKIKFKEGNVTQLNFKKNSFDLVLLLDVLEHLNNNQEIKTAITECYRVCRQTLIISLPQFYFNKIGSWLSLFDPEHIYFLIRNPQIKWVYSEKKFKNYLQLNNLNYRLFKGKCQSYYLIAKFS